MEARTNREDGERWPALPLPEWQETLDTLHMWTQIVGKVKLELTPFLNQWWNVAFQVTPRGLTTGPIPGGTETFAVDFDFIDHRLIIHTSQGAVEALPLGPRTVADFYAEFMGALRALGIDVAITRLPVEIPDPIPLDQDRVHASYDPASVYRWWRILVQTERVLQRFRTPFAGKSSPVLFYWGSFDLNHTRFSGRTTSPPASWPRFMQVAEDQENFACGFWPGNVTASGVTLGEPAFYAYIYPEPPGFKEAAARPAGAIYHPDLGEFILPYEAARAAAAPEAAVLDFLRTTYEAAAAHARWDRARLEYPGEGGVER